MDRETLPVRPLPGTDLLVTPLCAGGALLAGRIRAFGYDVPEERALATIRTILDGPITFLDTSAGYGEGESERRIGIVLAERRDLPAGFVLATKIDPDPGTGDFSGRQALRSAEQSLRRLGLERLDILHLHDPERIGFEAAMAPDGPVEAMLRLRREGLVRYLGVAGGDVPLLRRFVATGAFQVVLTHNRFTLVDRSARPLLTDAAGAGMGALNAAPYGGGVLVKGPSAVSTYAYRDMTAGLQQRVEGAERICREAGVPLAAAALQFSVREPGVGATVVGFSRPERVAETLALLRVPVPEQVWDQLEALDDPRGVGPR